MQAVAFSISNGQHLTVKVDHPVTSGWNVMVEKKEVKFNINDLCNIIESVH